jgi:hypothetical protein
MAARLAIGNATSYVKGSPASPGSFETLLCSN